MGSEGKATEVMMGATMAKPKAKPRRGRPAAAQKTFKTLGYRVSAEYLDWIKAAATVNRSDISGLIDQAVTSYAREIGVEDPPPDRTA